MHLLGGAILLLKLARNMDRVGRRYSQGDCRLACAILARPQPRVRTASKLARNVDGIIGDTHETIVPLLVPHGCGISLWSIEAVVTCISVSEWFWKCRSVEMRRK